MRKFKIKFYDEYLYYEKIKNGIEVYIIPNNKVKDTYVTFTTKYGGCNYPFKLNGKEINVPDGIAHFLEHKMFEQKNKQDPFTFYNKSGTYCNAFTNYFNTSYMFSGNSNFDDNLNYLLDFVQEPYFTDKNVLKEKGIIEQEIKMYDDLPDNIIYERSLYNLLVKHPIKRNISGTVEDVYKITKEDLYNCYKAFYSPKNMFLVITGNVDPKSAISIIKNNQKNKKFDNVKVEVNLIDEIDKVDKKKEIIKHNVSIPYVSYSIKIPINSFNMDRKKLNIYLSFIFNILFDETSLFYEEAKDKGLLNTSIDIDTVDIATHKIMMLIFKSDKYNDVLKLIDKVLSNIKISSLELERKKKVDISNILYIFDNISKTNNMILNNKIIYNNFYTNEYDIINSMNIDELNNIISNLNLENRSILIIENRD